MRLWLSLTWDVRLQPLGDMVEALFGALIADGKYVDFGPATTYFNHSVKPWLELYVRDLSSVSVRAFQLPTALLSTLR